MALSGPACVEYHASHDAGGPHSPCHSRRTGTPPFNLTLRPLCRRDGRTRQIDVRRIDLPVVLYADRHIGVLRAVLIDKLQREAAVGRKKSNGIDRRGWPPFDHIQTHGAGSDEAGEVGDGVVKASQRVRPACRIDDDDPVLPIVWRVRVRRREVVRTAHRVEGQVPVYPAGRAGLQLTSDAMRPGDAVKEVAPGQRRCQRRISRVLVAAGQRLRVRARVGIVAVEGVVRVAHLHGAPSHGRAC